MVIQIDGGSSTNKGAQLMMIAVLQESKRRFPNAKLIINNNNPDVDLIKTVFGNNFRLLRKVSFYNFVNKFRLVRIANLFSRKAASFFTTKHSVKGADIVFNIGGFQFGDQWNHNHDNIENWRDYLKKLHQYGSKTIFLPQAFGPFEKQGSKKMLEVLKFYADLLIARDELSYNYLKEGGVDCNKLLFYPDFTANVEVVEIKKLIQYKGKVCIIPNCKIIEKGIMDKESYLSALSQIINYIYQNRFEALLLNHEGKGDFDLCKEVSSLVSYPIKSLSGLNALETKSIIGSSYLVISSRFHGVANSLSTGVPCLATSWSHKYKELLEEYGQKECLIDLSKIDSALEKVGKMLDADINASVKLVLKSKNVEVKLKIKEMWDKVWGYISI